MPGHGPVRKPDPRPPLSRPSIRSVSSGSRAANQEYELTPLETRLIPVSYAQADELQARARICSRPACSDRGRLSAPTSSSPADISGNLNNIESSFAPRHPTPQGSSKRESSKRTTRYLRDIGIQWGVTPLSPRRPVTRLRLSRSPRPRSPPSAVTTTEYSVSSFCRRSRATCPSRPSRNQPCQSATGTRTGGAITASRSARSTTTSTSGSGSRPPKRAVPPPHRVETPNPDPRQTRDRRPDQQGHSHSVQPDQRPGRSATFQEAKLQLLVKPPSPPPISSRMHVENHPTEPTSTRPPRPEAIRRSQISILIPISLVACLSHRGHRRYLHPEHGSKRRQVPFFGETPILGTSSRASRATDKPARARHLPDPPARIVNRRVPRSLDLELPRD